MYCLHSTHRSPAAKASLYRHPHSSSSTPAASEHIHKICSSIHCTSSQGRSWKDLAAVRQSRATSVPESEGSGHTTRARTSGELLESTGVILFIFYTFWLSIDLHLNGSNGQKVLPGNGIEKGADAGGVHSARRLNGVGCLLLCA